MVSSGSSPLTRGKLGRFAVWRFAGRLIPAHAGKTSECSVSVRRCPAHPRSRGENDLVTRFFEGRPGSSPLTRGKLDDVQRGPVGPRLIPAHAGKTLPVSPRRSRTRAHPRSHGENMGLPIGYVSTPGSSPLTRGKRASGWHGASCGGLIPAHAGKTDQRGARGSTRAAHPRSRGENGRCSLSFSLLRGSSPLTRGKRGLVVACEVGARLIPAHAGKTPYGTTPHLQSGAHPRSRGENSASALAFSRPHGSSPLTRGKLPRELVDVLSEGLIPAHAGKTRRPRPHPCQDAAHPRSRGENSTEGVSMSAVTGSSPLTRGKLERHAEA